MATRSYESAAAQCVRPAHRDAEAEAAENWPSARLAWYAAGVLACVLMFGTIENAVITYLIHPIKRDFGLSDLQMSILIGAAPSIFYVCIGLPLARLVDSVRRNVLLSIVLGVAGVATSLSGLTQRFWQFAVCRMSVGGGGAISNPGTYSLLADYFPRARLTRAIAVLTLGLVLGRGLAPMVAGFLITVAAAAGAVHFGGMLIREWQLVFVMTGTLGICGALLMLTVREPARRGTVAVPGRALPFLAVFQYVWMHRRLYLPQFLALACFAVESQGIELWRVEFLRRTYGWTAAMSAAALGPANLIASVIGLTLGTRLTEWLARRYDDANLRTVGCCYLIAPFFAALAPLMPSPWLSIACSGVTSLLGIACVAPQNAALQSVTPNEMRGRITAMYYFIYSAIGVGFGPTLMAWITDVLIGDEAKIRFAMSLCAGVMLPVAGVCIWMAVKPYGQAIRTIKARQTER
jgi:MFS family permease